ncbi:hypothetical protein LTR53_018234, partial [Teratosphaeriaceae sp. CCFEE 6253]
GVAVAKYEQPPNDYYSTPYAGQYAAVLNAQAPSAQHASALPPPQQQQVAALHALPTQASFDPAAWRHFAENMVTGTQPVVPVGVQTSGVQGAEGFIAALTAAAVPAVTNGGVVANGHAHARAQGSTPGGGMAMPDQSQAWPMVQYSSLAE